MTIAVIDGDSIAYRIGWLHRDHEDSEAVITAVKQFMNELLVLTGAQGYFGALGGYGNFRDDVYLYQPYKAGRALPEPWLLRWKPVINSYLVDQWAFESINKLEADDLVAFVATELLEPGRPVICSPDKDLQQLAGTHYDYSRDKLSTVSKEIAHYNFWKQMLTGDDTDNVAGIPGIGDIKAEKRMKDWDPEQYNLKVRLEYIKYYGPHYGLKIFDETYQTLMLVRPGHPVYDNFSNSLENLTLHLVPKP